MWPQICVLRENHPMRKLIFACIVVFPSIVFGQSFHIGLFGGISNYQGDLVQGAYNSRFTNPAIGLTANYEVMDRLMVRGGFTLSKVEGHDKYNKKDYLKLRNLSFESKITEFSLVGEYSIFNIYNIKWTPYVFAGLAVYHFNPYAVDSTGNKVFLKPLSTEGQGLAAYPESKPYSLTQIAVPFGGGIKYAINDNFRIGLEVGIRKLFTDYLDDLSTNYADAADLLAERGQLAVDYAYRGDEVPGGDPNYPLKGAQRGGAKEMDWYYFTGLHLTYRIGGGFGSGGGKNKMLGCPKVVQ